MGAVRGTVVAVLVVALVVRAAAAPQDGIKLVEGGYTGLQVALSNELNGDQCVELFQELKRTIQLASERLFLASGGKVYFRHVKVIIPLHWTCADLSPEYGPLASWDTAHFRVGPSHHLFQDNPWTQQLGGCGEPGDFIYISDAFLLNTRSLGKKENVVVHEWAKYRWGVFEEYGHTGDPIYPASYLLHNDTFSPSYCTDHTLQGDSECDDGTEEGCVFVPDTSTNTSVTSSLLAAPFLDSVVNFCDGSTHNKAVPTKHNLLCDQLSVWEVMNGHQDFAGGTVSRVETNVSAVWAKPPVPRQVLLVDYTNTMSLVRSRWAFLRDCVLQFIMTEATDASEMAVVMFGNINTYTNVLPLDVAGNREDLAAAIPDDAPVGDGGSKDLKEAFGRAVEVLGEKGGTLLLLTENMKSYNEQLVDAAKGNPVWPILYPSDATVSTAMYDDLAAASGTTVLTVPDKSFDIIGSPYQHTENSKLLSEHLLKAASEYTIMESKNCEGEPCTMTLSTDINSYDAKGYIKVFYNLFDESHIVTEVKDPSGAEPTQVNKEGTNTVFTVDPLQARQYQVTVSTSSGKPTFPIYADFLGRPKSASLGVQVEVSSPRGLTDLQYSPGHAPRLLATVTSGAQAVLYAHVTAEVRDRNNAQETVRITLSDGGTGGDVTGRDGVYSGYLVGFEPSKVVSITVTATDNNGTARVVLASPKAAPSSSDGVACCGSQLDISSLELEETGTFTSISSNVSGQVTGMSPGTLPPGRVTDLRALRSGDSVRLLFTAPGGTLDQGTADEYEVRYQKQGGETSTEPVIAQAAGAQIETTITPPCGDVYTYTVVAVVGETEGSASNEARAVVKCGGVGSPRLSAGQIAGITVGCVLGVLLIILIVYLCLNRDHLGDLWLCRMVACQCCRKDKNDDPLYNPPPPRTSRNDVIRTNDAISKPARNLNDLYSPPNLEAKREARLKREQDDDDGGFGEAHRRQEQVQMGTAMDRASSASSNSTIAINKVGLPAGHDNHGYDGGSPSYYGKPDNTWTKRANTQV